MGWTHAICETCYGDFEPGRRPVQVREAKTVECCFCGDKTAAGIFYRYDPAMFGEDCNHTWEKEGEG